MQKHENASLSRRAFMAGSAAALSVAGLSLSGCGSKSTGADGAGKDGKVGGKLTGACAYTSTNVNPIGNSSALMLAATWHVFEGLYDLDLHTYKTYNALAAGEPKKISDKEYEVALREGAVFSDGNAVKASDVVNAFEKNIKNATYGAFLSFIDKVAAKDDKTISFKLKYPFGDLLKARLSVVKIFPAALTEDQLKKMPIGSGSWKYKAVNGNDGGTLVFEPNDKYTGEFPAGAKSMEWNVLLDETSRTTALQEASVQVMENVPDANAGQLKAAGATVEYVQGFNQAFFMFNTLKKPFDDPRVRQAFFYAVNVDKLIKNQMTGNATAVTGFLPKNHKNYHAAATQYTYDPAKAKKLLEDAGATGTAFKLLTNNNWVKGLAAQIKNDLDAVGLKCTIDEQKIDWSALAPSDKVLNYDVCLTPGDPTCFGNDPDLLMTWWYGDNVWTKGRTCWAKAPNSKFKELQDLMQKAREAKSDEQQKIWNQCFDIIASEVPLYPLFHRKLATGFQPTMIKDFAPIATTGLVFLGAKPLEA